MRPEKPRSLSLKSQYVSQGSMLIAPHRPGCMAGLGAPLVCLLVLEVPRLARSVSVQRPAQPPWRTVPELSAIAGVRDRETQASLRYTESPDSSDLALFPDCPANGLCCFDGCADTCVDLPKPTAPPTTLAPAPLQVEPVVAESKPEPAPGYSYPVPEIPFELPAPSRPPSGLPTLYEVPF